MYCSQRFTYSISAQNATYRKRKKYQDNESVCLVDDKNDVIPADDYCDRWNDKRNAELKKLAEKESAIIAKLPRVYADNYDEDFSGLRYESFDILECIDKNMESTPIPYYTQSHQKKYHNIKVYKLYKCKCYLCGKEIDVTCDKFGIYPPTEYGYNAYFGYWSNLYCECHFISSFQWIVNKLLFENKVDYRVEVSFEDLYGVYGENKLKYDFAIYNEQGDIDCLIECQGEQHYKPVEEFGGKRQFELQVKNDELKREYARKHKLHLIEISYKNKRIDRVSDILHKEGIL